VEQAFSLPILVEQAFSLPILVGQALPPANPSLVGQALPPANPSEARTPLSSVFSAPSAHASVNA
jgi:hypothetical protein